MKSVVEAARNPPSAVYPTNDDRTYDHSGNIINPEQAGKQFSACGESGGCVRYEKYNDKNRSDRLKDLTLISVSVTEKRRKRDRIAGYESVAADPFCYDPPVYVRSDGESDGSPSGVGNTCQIGQTGKPHQKPAAHIGGFGAHCRHKRSETYALQDKNRSYHGCSWNNGSDIEHGAKINNNGDHNTNVFCCHVCHSFLSQNVQYIVKLYHNKGISSRNKSLVKIHIYFV